MRIALLLLAGAALAAAVPARAQTGPCRSVEPPRPLRRAERARDSVRNAIRDTPRTELRQAARDAGIAMAEGLRFHPAAVDDVPVDAWVEQPVMVQIPDAGREGRWPE